MKALDIDAIRAFLLIADYKSFTRAAQALDTTQAAVSLKVKRLERELGRRLLERTPRHVRLSSEGSAFLEPARALVSAHQQAIGAFEPRPRRLIVGLSHHLAGAQLPRLLKRLNEAEPAQSLEMRVAASRDLLAAFDAGALDAALVLQHDSRRLDGDIVVEEAFGWMAAEDFVYPRGSALRLATQPAPCSVRAMAVDALDRAGIAWTELFLGGGVATIGAAVAAGLAVAALVKRVAPPGAVDVGARLGLPPLPTRNVVLYASATDAATRRALKVLAEEMRSGACVA
ncbi:LysR family transcriptional regulator [Paraburkholderia tropica]|uniref:LysR family transcriptional regulator n=1 Tax=Paraburkholderia TaxID=1822464 RepID=UPI001CAFC814|nr:MULTISPECIES: LysR family transcriptional regulator [Paraburkholderia]CAG9205010.1 LysR family transcriptional regulator [Paraburkholderia tropica]